MENATLSNGKKRNACEENSIKKTNAKVQKSMYNYFKCGLNQEFWDDIALEILNLIINFCVESNGLNELSRLNTWKKLRLVNKRFLIACQNVPKLSMAFELYNNYFDYFPISKNLLLRNSLDLNIVGKDIPRNIPIKDNLNLVENIPKDKVIAKPENFCFFKTGGLQVKRNGMNDHIYNLHIKSSCDSSELINFILEFPNLIYLSIQFDSIERIYYFYWSFLTQLKHLKSLEITTKGFLELSKKKKNISFQEYPPVKASPCIMDLSETVIEDLEINCLLDPGNFIINLSPYQKTFIASSPLSFVYGNSPFLKKFRISKNMNHPVHFLEKFQTNFENVKEFSIGNTILGDIECKKELKKLYIYHCARQQEQEPMRKKITSYTWLLKNQNELLNLKFLSITSYGDTNLKELTNLGQLENLEIKCNKDSCIHLEPKNFPKLNFVTVIVTKKNSSKKYIYDDYFQVFSIKKEERDKRLSIYACDIARSKQNRITV